MGINLSKGQKIDLTKKDASGAAASISNFCVGVNWGVIEKRGFFGTKKEAVDLDASCVVVDANGRPLDLVYFGSLHSKDGAIHHSGDDRTGDVDGDDGLDNEVIQVDLNRLHPSVDQIVFCLNSFQQQDFATIPFAAIRLYEGTPERVGNVMATYDIATGPEYRGFVSMIMGKLYKRNGEWKFAAIGDPVRDRDLEGTIRTILQSYL